MKKRPGKENALIFGVGMGGFESILNGATVYITNIIAALLINSIGSTEYFKKLALKGEELAQTQKLFTEQAATPSSSFFYGRYIRDSFACIVCCHCHPC